MTSHDLTPRQRYIVDTLKQLWNLTDAELLALHPEDVLHDLEVTDDDLFARFQPTTGFDPQEVDDALSALHNLPDTERQQ